MPLAGQPERPRGSRLGAAAPPWPLPGLTLVYPPADSTLPRPGKSGTRPGVPPGGRLPWPLAGARKVAKASSSVHATAATPRSIPRTARGSGLVVPSPRGGRASHTAAAAAAAAAPPLTRAQLDPHLGGLLLAESCPARGIPFFYPRQSPPSRQCIKPFRPDCPGTSMRESSGEGPLPPGPPPAFCSAGRSADSNARSHVHTPHVLSLAHNRTHFSLSCKLTHAVHSLACARTHSSVTHMCARTPHSPTLTLIRARILTHSHALILLTGTHSQGTVTRTYTPAQTALTSPQDVPPLGGPRGNVPPIESQKRKEK